MPEQAGQNGRVLEFSGFRLSLHGRRLTRADGDHVPLRPRIYDLLALFATRPGELLEKRVIMDAVWPDTHVDDNNLNQAISELRRSLGDDWHEPRFIITVPRRGYQFVATVRIVDDVRPEPPMGATGLASRLQLRTSRREPATIPRHARVSRMVAWSALPLVAVVALIVSMRSPPATIRPAPLERSIAVMPFSDMSALGDQAYFADGLAEELIDHLTRIDALDVIARASSFTFRDRDADARTIGEALGASHLLQGSVRREADDLRISARLVDAATGMNLWSETFERKLDDVFAIQEEVARSVAGALAIQLGVGESLRAIGDTDDVAAYDAVLKARAWVNQESRQALVEAARLYREALQRDPDFAVAWAELARVLSTYQYLVPDRAVDVRDEMERAVNRALEIEPDLWIAHAVQGDLLSRRRDWAGAMRSYERFRNLAPTQANINTEFLIPLLLGNVDEAVAWSRASIAINPLSLRVSRDAQIALMRADRFDEAEAEYERSLDLVGDRVSIEHYRLMRIWDDAEPETVQEQMRLVANLGSSIAPTISAVSEVFDDPDAALEILREAAHDPVNQDSLRLPTLAAWLSHYGDPELALDLLRRTYVELESTTYVMLWNPPLGDVRRLPEFKALVTELGMVEYWRSTGEWGYFCRPLGESDFECA